MNRKVLLVALLVFSIGLNLAFYWRYCGTSFVWYVTW